MISNDEIVRVKGLGFLRDKRTEDKFNARVITGNGKITSEQMKKIAEAAEKFGSAEIAMTTRQTVEIQGIPFENIEPLRKFLAEYGLETGGTGAKVRPVVSCKGTTCVFGLIDSYALSEEIHNRFYKGWHGVNLPHKFKIAVGGCPNNCVKPDLNDLGIIGQKIPSFDSEKCRGCKKCLIAEACPMKAISISDGKAFIDKSICNNCGRCVGKCPFKANDSGETGFKICIGGRWGKKTAKGLEIPRIFTSTDEVLNFIEKAILFFKEYGNKGERFNDTVNRIGFDSVCAELLSDDILNRKEGILNG